MLMTILVMVRDVLVAAALAWVGVTLETRVVEEPQACEAQTCADQQR